MNNIKLVILVAKHVLELIKKIARFVLLILLLIDFNFQLHTALVIVGQDSMKIIKIRFVLVVIIPAKHVLIVALIIIVWVVKLIAFIPTSLKIKISRDNQKMCWDIVYQNVQVIMLQNLEVYYARNVILLVRNVINLLLLVNVLFAIQTLPSTNIYNLKVVLQVQEVVWLPAVHLMQLSHHLIKLAVQNVIAAVCNANLQKIQLHALSVIISLLIMMMIQANN